MMASIGSPVTSPSVPGDQARGNPMMGAYCGSMQVPFVMGEIPSAAEFPFFEFGGDAVFLHPFDGPVSRLAVSAGSW